MRPAPAANTAVLTASTWVSGTKNTNLYIALLPSLTCPLQHHQLPVPAKNMSPVATYFLDHADRNHTVNGADGCNHFFAGRLLNINDVISHLTATFVDHVHDVNFFIRQQRQHIA